jgi:hypothetical protein
MSKRSANWLAWFTWVLYLVIAIADLLLKTRDTHDLSALFNDIIGAVILLAFATIGLLIASRRPENLIGWLFCISTLLWALGDFFLEYATFTLITAPGSLPAGALVGAVGNWIRSLGFFLVLTYLLLLFPDGHLPSPRWRFLAWLIAGLLVAYSIVTLFSPYPYANIDLRLAGVRNPLGILVANDLVDAVANFMPLLLFPSVVACIVAVIQRFRRSQGVPRQQLKWFAYGTALSILMIVVIIILVFSSVTGSSSSWPFYLAVVCIPISAGIGILRYRLFDIDVLINRTLVYGGLTATLLAIYLVLVFGGQYLLSSFFGHSNTVVLVVSTLLVAALFQPLRRRVQRLVDRRFYRSKYDATKVVAGFSATLRQEVNLEQLYEHFLAVVQETVQPAYLSLWLRSEKSEVGPPQTPNSSGK